MSSLLTSLAAADILTITLNRPDIHNAFDDRLIDELMQALRSAAQNPDVRLVVLTGTGKSFSAGADLNWMRRMAVYTEEENYHDAMALGELMGTLNRLPKPTIARVNGSAYGGGVGLIACCDIAIGVTEAQFALSETKLGLIPAVISPYVVAAIGEKKSRRYFLTGERFSAAEARAFGLLNEIVPADQLDLAVTRVAALLLEAGPIAQAEAKDLISAVAHRPVTDSLITDTAERIARVRISPEGQEGLAAFLDKRKPNWTRCSKKS
ncbi:MAG: enoyl-CoA hydratase/isomerase family protein [Burkholderiales bacterium]